MIHLNRFSFPHNLDPSLIRRLTSIEATSWESSTSSREDGGKKLTMFDPDLYPSHNYHEADLNFSGRRWGEERSRLAFIITSPSKTFIELRLKPLHWFFARTSSERKEPNGYKQI